MTVMMKVLSRLEILLVVLGHLELQACSCSSDNITFLSYFPCTDLPDGNATSFIENCDFLTYVASKLAVEEINDKDNVLNGSFVNLVSFATGKDGPAGLCTDSPEAVVFHSATYLQALGTLHGVVGPADVDVIARIAPLVSNRSNTIEVGLVKSPISGQTLVRSPVRGREQVLYEVADTNYPFVHSTLPSEEFVNNARISLLLLFRWVKVATLASSERAYRQAHENFNRIYARAFDSGLTAVVATSFVESPDSALREIQRSGTKIIFGFFGPSDARKVLCRAEFFGLTTSEHVWLLPSYYATRWWQLEAAELDALRDSERCSNQNMMEILESTLFLGATKFSLLNEASTAIFHSKLIAKTQELFPDLQIEDLSRHLLYSRARRAYEAVWLLALAWNSSMIYQDDVTLLRNALNEAVWTTKFCEWCGMYSQCFANRDGNVCQPYLIENKRVIFTDGVLDGSVQNLSVDYYGQVLVSQFVGGSICPIGFFWPSSNLSSSISPDNTLEFVRLSNLSVHDCLGPRFKADAAFVAVSGCPVNFTWKGGSRPSGDFSLTVSFINISGLVIVVIFILCGFAFAVTLLVLDFVLRKNRHIKASSPKLNVVIIIAYVMDLPTPFLLGLTFSGLKYNFSLPHLTICCQLFDWLSKIPPVLFFAALLVKNWRLYRVFCNNKLTKSARAVSTDEILLVGITFFTVPMFMLLTVQTVVDPYRIFAGVARTTKDIRNFNFINITYCSSEHEAAWNSSAELYIVFLILALSFLAYKNSKIPENLKDFKAEGIALHRTLIFTVTLQAGLTAFLIVFIISNPLDIETVFWVITARSVLIPTIIIAVIFMPKFLVVYRSRRQKLKQKKWRRESALQEEEYKRLRSRADTLQKELTLKEEKIASLKGHATT